MPDNEEKPIPTITLRLTDAEKFVVETEMNVPSPVVARCMLNEALESLKTMIADQEAAAFGAKMNAAAKAHRAMQKLPKM